jgi:hypothetical protein
VATQAPIKPAALSYDKPLTAVLDGFTLHAATRAGAQDTTGREALLGYALRPPIAQERITEGPEGLVRLRRKRPFSDGTVAIDMAPLSTSAPGRSRGTSLCAARVSC